MLLGKFLKNQLLVVMLCALCGVVVSGARANETFEPVFNPDVFVTKVEEGIKIDGDISSLEWQNATEITQFVEHYPGDNIEPEVATRAYITYDNDNVYVAFICNDDPSSVRATMSQRDQFDGDDVVGVQLDTYGDASWAYEFYVNPHGVQKDRLWSNVGGMDLGFDLIWSSAGMVTDSGYQVEMALPFSSMRFPNKSVQNWKMNLARNRPRESLHQYSWAAIERDEQCGPCQWGTITGIGDVHPGRGLEILPTFITYRSDNLENHNDPNSELRDGEIYGEMSVGGKYSLSSDATLEAAYNPDFSQIESDAGQVDVNTTIALFFPEKRPFFQEGADVFRTLFNSFYTRTVNDPEYAVKLVSRKPNFTLGFMSAQDENTPYLLPLEESSALLNAGRSYVNVLRGTRPIGEASQVGFIVSDRRLEGGGYGTILGLDGNIRLSPIYSIDGQFIKSYTGEPDKAGVSANLDGISIDEDNKTAVFDGESFEGNALITRFKRFSRHWSFIADYNQVDPSYRTLTGYDPWVNYRNASMWNQYTFYPENGIFQRIEPQLYVDGRWLYDGTRRWEHQNFSLNTQLRWAQTRLSVFANRGSEAWTSRVTGNLNQYEGLRGVGLNINSSLSNKVGYYLSLERGRGVARFADAIGTETSSSLGLTLKPDDRLVIEPNVDFVRSDHLDNGTELFKQTIVRTRVRFQFSRELSVRLVVEHNNSKASIYIGDNLNGDPSYFVSNSKSWTIDPLVTYRINSFSVLHAGSAQYFDKYTDDNPVNSKWRLNSRQFFIKLQYLFQG